MLRLALLLLGTISTATFAQGGLDDFRRELLRKNTQSVNAVGRIDCVRKDNNQRDGAQITFSATGPNCAAARQTVSQYFAQADRCTYPGNGAPNDLSRKAGTPIQWLSC